MPAPEKSLFAQTWFNLLRAVLYAAGFISFFVWMALQVRAFDSRLGFAPPAATVGLGLALMFIGGFVAVSCMATFVVRGRGTPALFDPPRQFVAVGPYRYVRNPMYLGGFTLLVGWALYLRSLSILLMSGILVLLVHCLVVFYEEPALKRKFGGAYDNYLAAVGRWLPRLPGWS